MMSGYIADFFGYPAEDTSEEAKRAAKQQLCPFVSAPCSKRLNDGKRSGVCAVRQIKSDEPVICCPNRIYADNYRILHIIADRSFDAQLPLAPASRAVKLAQTTGGAIAVFGHGWGGELRLPKRDGVGNYFADWVLARINSQGNLVEFTSIEVQTIDTTGNYRDSISGLLNGRKEIKSTVGLNWENVSKRIIPQLVYKGQVLQRESLCKTGLWFVTPETVYERILTRLGGEANLVFGYAPQPGALHFLRYDYDWESSSERGPIPLMVTGEDITTVEKVQQAFANVGLPEAGVYGSAIQAALNTG